MENRHFSIVEKEYNIESETDDPVEYHAEYYFFPGNIAKTVSRASVADVSLFPGETEPKKGDKIYVTTVTYSTGDSFVVYNNKKHFVWAFTNKNNAKSLADAIKNKKKSFKGMPIESYMWEGDFNTLESVDILEFTLN